MNVSQILSYHRDRTNAALEAFLDSLKPTADRVGSPATEAWQVVRDFTMRGGKRIRPALMCLAFRAAGGREDDSIVVASCAIELMQSFLLIHDDLMDHSALRRGAPTVHKIYEQLYAPLAVPDLDHMSYSLAILAGDIAMSYGAMAITRANFPPEYKTRALEIFFEIVTDEGYGQILDMRSGLDHPITEADIYDIFYYKTTRYTLEGPLHLGAALAGADADMYAALSRYAVPLGKAFQLQDDILGMFGDEETIGKPADSDLKEGKRTLLILKALERGSPAQRDLIQSKLGCQDLTANDLERMRQVIRETGALDYAHELVQGWVTEAKAALDGSALRADVIPELSLIADYLARRES